MNSFYSVVLMCRLLKRLNSPVDSDFKCRAASLIFYSSEVDARLVASYGETLVVINSTNEGFLLCITEDIILVN